MAGTAAGVLAGLGPRAKAAVPAPVDLLRSKDMVAGIPHMTAFSGTVYTPGRLAAQAATALGKIDPDADIRAAAEAAINPAVATPPMPVIQAQQ